MGMVMAIALFWSKKPNMIQPYRYRHFFGQIQIGPTQP